MTSARRAHLPSLHRAAPALGPGGSSSYGGRVRAAVPAARLAAFLSRNLRGGSGLVISGRVLLATAPEAPRALSRGRRVTLVSGTNGKTTTTALTVAALGGTSSVGSNRGGANTAAGVAGTLATTHHHQVVLEVDEGWLSWAIERIDPATVVLTNLSRDQLSRHHEVGALVGAWREALTGLPLVVANAEDPDVVWPAMAARSQVWVAAHQEWNEDSLVCPRCRGRCRRERGSWRCDSCDLRRPEPDWWVDGTVLRGRGSQVDLALELPGTFNAANAAMAVVAAHLDGISLAEAAHRVSGVTSVAGRFEKLRRGPHELRLMLAKNPAGWLELLAMMAPDRHPVVLLFNAEGVDGRDPSWLYDVSFTALRGRQVLVQGRRAMDLQVRLQLDGVHARCVSGSLLSAFHDLPPGRVDVVGNYTAFQSARAELRA